MRSKLTLIATLIREQLLGAVNSQLIRGKVLGHRSALGLTIAFALDVRPVAANAQRNAVTNGEGVDGARIDVTEVVDQALEALAAPSGRPIHAKVELSEPVRAVHLTRCDAVEVLFHVGREVVVDEPVKVLLHQPNNRERNPRGDERLIGDPHIPARHDEVNGGRVRRGPAKLPVFELLDHGTLRESRRRSGRVRDRLEALRTNRVPLVEARQTRVLVVGHLRLVVFVPALFPRLFVGGHEARRGDDGAGGGELNRVRVG